VGALAGWFLGLVDGEDSELFAVSLTVAFGAGVVGLEAVALVSVSLVETLLFDSDVLLDTLLEAVSLGSDALEGLLLDVVTLESDVLVDTLFEGFAAAVVEAGVEDAFLVIAEGVVVVVGNVVLVLVVFAVVEVLVVVAAGDGFACSAEEGDRKGDDVGPLSGA
jgi:hypothetical protein